MTPSHGYRNKIEASGADGVVFSRDREYAFGE